MLKRYEDWPTRLDAFIRRSQPRSFAWGENDCCLFACDAVLEMTGVDLADGLRGNYKAALAARRLIKKFAGVDTLGDLADLIARRKGIREVPPAFAQRGDVVLLTDAFGREAIGIIGLSGDEILAPGEQSLAQLPISAATRAWRI
jgi:hypothetical protein